MKKARQKKNLPRPLEVKLHLLRLALLVFHYQVWRSPKDSFGAFGAEPPPMLQDIQKLSQETQSETVGFTKFSRIGGFNC